MGACIRVSKRDVRIKCSCYLSTPFKEIDVLPLRYKVQIQNEKNRKSIVDMIYQLKSDNAPILNIESSELYIRRKKDLFSQSSSNITINNSSL